MGTPIKSVVAFSDCKGSSARPEVLKPHRLQAFKVCRCRCTMDAKERLEKSITYEANFWVLCKCLQENILILGYNGVLSSKTRVGLIYGKPLKINNKTHVLLKATDWRASTLLAHQLHSFLASRGGSRGSC